MISGAPTYWVVPREVMDPALSDEATHRALLTYVILFSGPALISDSNAIRDRFLKHGLRADVKGSGDGFMRTLTDRGYLRFAIRARNGLLVPLAKTEEQLGERATEAQIGFELPGEKPEYRYIEDHAAIVAFEEEHAKTRYQHETLRLFQTSPFSRSELPQKYRTAITGALEERIAQGPFFGLSDFRRGSSLWTSIRQRVTRPDLADRYLAFAHAVARGPYVTYFPETFGISPTYSPHDSLGIDRCGVAPVPSKRRSTSSCYAAMLCPRPISSKV